MSKKISIKHMIVILLTLAFIVPGDSNRKAFIISAIAILIGTLPIIFTSSFAVFVLYNVVLNIAYQITQILVDTTVFNIHSNEYIKKYYLEYTFIGEVFHGFGKTLSELILLLAVSISFNLINLRIVVAILSFSIVIQTCIYNRLCKNNKLAIKD